MTRAEDDFGGYCDGGARVQPARVRPRIRACQRCGLKIRSLITPTRPRLGASARRILLEVDFDGRVGGEMPAARPIEVFLHIGIYAAGAVRGNLPNARAVCVGVAGAGEAAAGPARVWRDRRGRRHFTRAAI